MLGRVEAEVVSNSRNAESGYGLIVKSCIIKDYGGILNIFRLCHHSSSTHFALWEGQFPGSNGPRQARGLYLSRPADASASVAMNTSALNLFPLTRSIFIIFQALEFVTTLTRYLIYSFPLQEGPERTRRLQAVNSGNI